MGSCLGHCCNFRRDFRCRRIFSCLRVKHKKDPSLNIELLDDAWSLSETDCKNTSTEAALNVPTSSKKNDVQQCRTPSLDLEWENLPEMEMSNYVSNVEDKESQLTTNSISTCSHGTSRDSLEWDPAVGGTTDFMDAETEQLLQEIEMLNSRVLEETQKWSS